MITVYKFGYLTSIHLSKNYFKSVAVTAHCYTLSNVDTNVLRVITRGWPLDHERLRSLFRVNVRVSSFINYARCHVFFFSFNCSFSFF